MLKTSIVIPCYKAEHTVERAIHSIFEDKDVISEVIVVEDGVYDNTRAVIKKLSEKNNYNIKVFTFKENKGAQAARNFGLSKVVHDTVMFLDSDDYVSNGLIGGLCRSIIENNSSLAFGPMKTVDPKGVVVDLREPRLHLSENEIVNYWLQGKSGPHPCAVMWKTSEVLRIGGWLGNMSRNQDGEIIFRAFAEGCKLSNSYVGAGVYCHHDGNRVSKINSRKSFTDQIAVLDQIEKLRKSNPAFDFYSGLSVFCFLVSLGAYDSGYADIGELWEKKWKHYDSLSNDSRSSSYKLRVAEILSRMVGISSFSKLTTLLKNFTVI